EFVAPGNPTEELLAGIWEEVLGVTRVGVHDNFFELGGHSLVATQVASRVRETFAVEVPLARIFEAPTLAELAGIIEAAQLEQRGLRISPMVPAPRDQELPLSFAQQRLWFLYQLEPWTPAYNISVAVRLSGAVAAGIIERIFNEVVRRHEALRTTFTTAGGRPVQVIAERLRLPLPVADLDRLSDPRRETEALHLAGEEAQRLFDLTVGPLVRVTLLRLAEEDHVLLVTMHHIVSDGWSMGIFIRELSVLFEAFSRGNPSPLAELPLQYADFAQWQRRWLVGEVLEAETAYWRVELAGAPQHLDLPTDRPRPAVLSFRGRTREIALSKELSGALAAQSRDRDVTLFMTLLAAFATLLYRYSGREDIVVGSPIAGRNRRETEGLIGFFVNTLVLRTKLDGNPSFERLSAAVRQTALNAYAHQNVPFEQLVDELQPQRDPSLHPLFQVMFVLQNTPRSAFGSSELTLTPLTTERSTATFDLTLSLQENADGLSGSIEYSTDLFDEVTIDRMAGHLRSLLAGIAGRPDERLSDHPLLNSAEKHQLRSEWNDTRDGFSESLSLRERIERWAERTPDAPAVVFDDRRLSFRELDRRANQLAHSLRARGVGPEVLVGICVERSVEMVVAVLGVLKAGGGWLPLDPQYPRERLAFMLEETRVPVVLTQERLLGTLPEHEAQVVCLDRAVAVHGEGNPVDGVRPECVAYVIYTSGSTGRPKGVMITHRNLSNLAAAQAERFGLRPADRVLQFFSLSFDGSVWEIAMALAAGAALHLASQEDLLPGPPLLEVLNGRRITCITLPPSALAGLGVENLPELATLIVAGEACPPELARQWSGGRRFVNAYGPTETTVCATCGRHFGDQRLSIGTPIANTRVYVLDRNLEMVPVGVAGELAIAGTGVARGYRDRPDLSAERFVPDPYCGDPAAGERLYRTGDLARRLPDGTIEFLGRIDHQVKLRGFRIELGEIEAILGEHPAVRETAVVVHELDQLVAFVVSDEEPALEMALRDLMKATLPGFMVPSALVFLDALPLTPSGKVDRAALGRRAGPARDALRADFVAPADPTEELLVGIWAEVLQREQVGAEDDFFDLGGHSLLATQVVSRVRETFGVELPLLKLFEASTLAELARIVRSERQEARGVAPPPLVPVERDQELPLSFAQQRLWFLDQFNPGSPAYNVSNAVRLPGAVSVARLEWIFNQLVRRHEALRTTFPATAGRPRQVIAERLDLPLPLADLQNLAEERRETEARRLAAEEALHPFDLTAGPLIRITLVRLAQQDHLLLVTMHHIISDGWSMGIFSRELTALYAAVSQGERGPRFGLPELPVQYADFAHWQRQWLTGEVLEAEMAYWRRQLDRAPRHLDLPTDRPRPAVVGYRGRIRELALCAELAGALATLSRAQDATLYMTLLAAFAVLLGRWCGRQDVLVGSPIAGRNHREIEGLIGFFVNTLVLRTDLAGDTADRGTANRDPSFEQLSARVRRVALDAYAHQNLPFESLVDELQPRRDTSLHPLFQVMFALQSTPPQPAGEGSGLALTPLAIERATAVFDLTLSLSETAAGIEGTLEYRTDLFDDVTILRLATHFTTLLAALVRDPGRRLSELPLLSRAENHQLTLEWNDSRSDYPRERPIHELFELRVRRTPDALAVVFGKRSLSYRELNRRANRLAHYLRALEVGSEVLTGIYLERSADTVVAILAVLKAGGAYLPLDLSYPPDRLAFMLEDAGAPVLVTCEEPAATLPAELAERGVDILCLDRDAPSIACSSDRNPGPAAAAGNLAYVIYTSGS
ncbi:MAG: amino acid adenylation domain-containing protein, partial [bacterium]|nr:amino acid adenylation domain-containing protein [bacterium]